MDPENQDSIDTQPAPPAAALPAASPGRLAMAWLRDLTISVGMALVVILFLYQPVRVEGTSMMPSLVDQERIFINKFAYRLGMSEIARGDTVVFWFPGDTSKSYIKRVIALPGDEVEITRGRVFVNDMEIDEPYVPDEYRDRISMDRMKVPDQQYFVLGDHRSSSNDSRTWGTVPRHFIYGRAAFVYWPLDRLGRVE